MKFFSDIKNLVKNKNLIIRFTKREFKSRYKGTVLGGGWSFILPLIMFLVYMFVFSVVFKAKWNVTGQNQASFAIILFAGLILFNFLSESIISSATVLYDHANLVKKVNFPIQILPFVRVIVSLINLLMSFILLLIAILVVGQFKVTFFLFPLVLVPLIFMIIGLSYFSSSLNVYLKDFGHMLGVLMTLVLFLSPIFYPIEVVPVRFQSFIFFNPFVPFLNAFRDLVIFGQIPSFFSFLIMFFLSFCVFFLGIRFFNYVRPGLADVL